MKQEISAPVAVIIAVVVVAVIAVVGWKWINREPTVTASVETKSASDTIATQPKGITSATQQKPGQAQMLNDAQ